VVSALLKKEMMQYLMLAILVYQGGGEQNWRLAVELNICFYVLHLALYEVDKLVYDR
jgi:hypothetical protein